MLIGGTVNTETSIENLTNLLRTPTGGRLTSWLFTSVGKELKLWIAVLQFQLVFSAGIEPGTSDSKSGVLTTRPHFLNTSLKCNTSLRHNTSLNAGEKAGCLQEAQRHFYDTSFGCRRQSRLRVPSTLHEHFCSGWKIRTTLYNS